MDEFLNHTETIFPRWSDANACALDAEAVLKKQVLADLVEDEGEGERVRVWVEEQAVLTSYEPKSAHVQQAKKARTAKNAKTSGAAQRLVESSEGDDEDVEGF